MSIDAARLQAVEALGYTPREAAFLVCVAQHSGYFVRRQFLQWIGRQQGQTVVDFTDRLVSRRHATVQTFCRTTQVYHLSAKALYGDGPHATVSQRRRRPAVSIKTRLMALDVVASQPDVTFLATESERVAFCDALGIDRSRLPQQHRLSKARVERARYVPKSALVGVQLEEAGAVLLFVYIDDGERSVAGFQTYLRRYARLLAVVPRWRLVHVSGATRHANAAAVAFRRAFGDHLASPPDADAETAEAVREYFHLRQAYEAQRWAALDTGKLDRFRVLRLRFNTDFDPLFARWELQGDAVLHEAQRRDREGPSRLETIVLPHSYAAIESLRRRS
jgi:hypothetical protein